MENYFVIKSISCARSAQEIGVMRTYVMIGKQIGIDVCAKRTNNRLGTRKTYEILSKQIGVKMCAKRTKNRCNENTMTM